MNVQLDLQNLCQELKIDSIEYLKYSVQYKYNNGIKWNIQTSTKCGLYSSHYFTIFSKPLILALLMQQKMGNFETKLYSIFIPHLLLHFFYYDILTTWKWSSIGDASFIRYSLGLKVWTLQYTEYDLFFMSKQVTNAYKLRKVVWRLAGFNCCEIAWNAIKRSLSILQIAKMTWSQVMSNIQAINMNITINNKNKLFDCDTLTNDTLIYKIILYKALSGWITNQKKILQS
jgi:hypothetical protein